MNNLIPFDFDGSAIRVLTDDAGEPWFVAMEIAEVLGYSDAFEMTKRLDDDERQNRQIAGFGPRGVTLISESGLFSAVLSSTKPEAKRFKRWVTHDVLPAIRKTGVYDSRKPAEPKLIAPAKDFRAVYGLLRLIGCDKQAAAIGANQATAHEHGTNLLALTGQTHLAADNQESRWYTPSELGKRIEVSGRQFNLLLAEAGLQMKQGDVWTPTPAAESFYRLFDTGKKHGSGVPVQQLKWADNVLALVKPAQEPA